ncbi:MAG TPA: DUF6492 family protein [Steroidobacteraceae bacterium]
MTQLRYGIVTPSFRLDLQRCQMLLETTARWVAPHVHHYVVVDRRDRALFRPICNTRTELLDAEDLIPGWLMRVPGMNRFWLSLRTRPVRNWILQQMVKLAVGASLPEDVLLYADSDMFFVAPFDPRSFERDGAVPLLVESGQRGQIANNDRTHAQDARLLGLPIEASYDTNYIGNLIYWRQQNVLATLERVQEVGGEPWQKLIAPLNAFSEYVLYGLHSHRILGERSGHWHDEVVRTLSYWTPKPLSIQGLEELKSERQPFHHSVMISAKSGTSVSDIRRVFN